jgi:hypothetical protein
MSDSNRERTKSRDDGSCTQMVLGGIRRKELALSAEHYNSIGLISGEGLSLFLGSAPWLTREYFLMLEQIADEQIGFHFVEIRQSGKLKALFSFMEIGFYGSQLEPFIPERLAGGVKSGIMMVLEKFKSRILVSGNLFMTGDRGMHFAPEVGPADMSAYLAFAVKSALKNDSSIGAYLLSDCYRSDETWTSGLRQEGFHRVESEADMVMHLPNHWIIPADYLNSLRAKYRTRLHRTLKASAAVVFRELNLPEIEAESDRLYDLYSNVVDGVKLTLARLPHAFFTAQKKIEPERYRVFGYFLEDKMIAFTSAYLNGQSLEVHYIGWQNETVRDLKLYERMLYEMILFGIRERVSIIHFGRTAGEVKSTMGAVPREMNGYVYHTRKIRNRFLGMMAKTLKATPVVYRSPFKDFSEWRNRGEER